MSSTPFIVVVPEDEERRYKQFSPCLTTIISLGLIGGCALIVVLSSFFLHSINEAPQVVMVKYDVNTTHILNHTDKDEICGDICKIACYSFHEPIKSDECMKPCMAICDNIPLPFNKVEEQQEIIHTIKLESVKFLPTLTDLHTNAQVTPMGGDPLCLAACAGTCAGLCAVLPIACAACFTAWCPYC